MPRITQQKVDTVTVDKDGHSRAKKVFDVEALSAVDAAAVLADERGIAYGAVYRNQIGEVPDVTLRVMTIVPSAKSPPVIGREALYEVQVEYGRGSGGGGGGGGGPRWPALDAVQYRWGRGAQTVEVEVDRHGKVIANARGERYEGISIPVPHRTLEALFWVPAADLVSIFSFDAAVNRSAWLIQGRYRADAGYALCHGLDPIDGAVSGDKTLVRGQFEFGPAGSPFNPVTFPAYTKIDGRRYYLDSEGSPVSVAPGSEPPVTERFEVVPEARLKDFNALGI